MISCYNNFYFNLNILLYCFYLCWSFKGDCCSLFIFRKPMNVKKSVSFHYLFSTTTQYFTSDESSWEPSWRWPLDAAKQKLPPRAKTQKFLHCSGRDCYVVHVQKAYKIRMIILASSCIATLRFRRSKHIELIYTIDWLQRLQFYNSNYTSSVKSI